MKKRALLVGINNYSKFGTLSDLHYACQDAEAFASALQTCYGFTENEITLMTCQKSGTLSPSTPYSILNQLSSELYSEPFDLFIFGFWGHSIWENDTRYYCPMSTFQNRLFDSGLKEEDVFDRVAKLPVRNSCFILDCCQASIGRDIGLNRKYKTAVQIEHNNAILNSCSPKERAYEWDERKHGIFTAHLLEAMKKRLDTVDQWASYVKDNVSQTAARLGKSSQTPHYSHNGCIELPAIKGKPTIDVHTPHVITESQRSSDVLQDALLQLANLFQDSERLYEDASVINCFRTQREQLLTLHETVKNGVMDASSAYTRLLTIAMQTGTWIRENRLLLKNIPFVSYKWCSWNTFAKENQLDEITRALNPK